MGLAAPGGHEPLLVAAGGSDFDELGDREWLTESGVDCSHLYVSETLPTARCTITTDDSHAQIATFYAGALADARKIDLAALTDWVGGIDLVLIGPDDPEAMLRHTQVCREVASTSAADPSGVGYSFRAGFLAAVAPGLSLERAAQVGCMVAPVIEV